ncbi:nitroreductase family protein [Amycolatopsis pithecellobii]|uniref:Nitroreductase n=1 Tax=Amycolatopsis pithecellobii TaxID=664692 RepID=A0A6N7ZCY5_9PSEU|nr:nitroreductase family protein [Amycolatopsis pithecellobii]MTD59555.1 nitroreductase [Amycolatopsis pithecellobii]
MSSSPRFDLSQTDRLLSTTRSVRKRLDPARPVPAEVILDCLRLAVQAPTGGNGQAWRWVVVTDAAKRRELARLYRESGRDYLQSANDQASHPQTRRVYESALVLADSLADIPVHVIPCIEGRVENTPNVASASHFGSIIPAAWSFMLALRSRGLGSAWTTLHLSKEEEVASLLGIPYESVTQVALLPVAYTTGGDFRPAARPPVENVTYWDDWGSVRGV